MTVEVGILNKHGVALATDSAVTIGNGRGYYNTANKLFALSKYHPVAIMLYSNAAFMDCPLEIIVKEYRKKLKDNKFNTLKEYWENFKEYLKKFVIEYNIDQNKLLVEELANFLDDVDLTIQQEIKNYIKELERSQSEEENDGAELKEEKLENEINKIILDTLTDIHNSLEELDNDEQFFEMFSEIKDLIEEDIKDKIDLIIGIELNDAMLELVLSCCYKIITKKVVLPTHTGIVIAGYGEKDIYPSIAYGEFSGCYFNRLKVSNEKIDKIDNSMRASIIPFAQDDVIKTFMNGIDSNYMEKIKDVINQNKIIKDIGDEDKENLIDEIIKEMKEISYTSHWGPMISTVSSAPKEELAQMAETLVNLTSFRRKMNMDEYSQTVGGPVDVAVITKGDGLIWIKRKQYFDKEINHQFIHNYFR